MAETIHDQLIAYLEDAHALEQMSLWMTEAAAETLEDPQMRDLFQHHHKETQEHERLIRDCLKAHGESPSSVRDGAAKIGAIAKAAAAGIPDDTPARLARDGYAQEQTEVASYELLSRVAQRAGDMETADVARRILANERETAAKIASTWDRAAELSLHGGVGRA